MLARLKGWARRIKREALTLWLVGRHPRTPWWVKVLALAVAAYAFSPIDLIPDFIPVLGLLDDVVILPFGILLVLRLTPPDVVSECRDQADRILDRPVSRVAAVVVVFLWAASILLAAVLGWRWWISRSPA